MNHKKSFIQDDKAQYILFQIIKKQKIADPPMKKQFSNQGLSQILEESDRQEFDHSKHLLARLSNQQFLSQYVQLNTFSSIQKQYEHLAYAPHNPLYRKFIFDPDRDHKQTLTQLRKNARAIEVAGKAALSPQQLKSMATKKMNESTSHEILSTSRRQKRQMYLSMLKTSQVQKQDKSNSQLHSLLHFDTSDFRVFTEESDRKDMSVQQNIDDLFMRIQAAGEERDYVKKQWYSWGQTTSLEDKKMIIFNWKKTHGFMQELLQLLMEKLTEQIGSPEVFRQLRIQNTSILSKAPRSKLEKTLDATAISAPTAQQKRQIVRFNQWFNKLLLDQRELEYIASEL